ncbi:MAG TPA: hypothetical protein PLU27_11655, partial [Ginsengibacter sp.]|nr:hypothetical protein [Ginsengibacter sp.]HRP45414.1 hypothetical protein [Ginsengibacter sp.]
LPSSATPPEEGNKKHSHSVLRHGISIRTQPRSQVAIFTNDERVITPNKQTTPSEKNIIF